MNSKKHINEHDLSENNVRNFDVVVVGAGHAGVEAACAAYRTGAKTALITMSADNMGKMSCNPAIGGIGKGTIVREIDALDGVMGVAADEASIMCRILNKSKGSAVWGWRSQIDREMYASAVAKILKNDYKDLSIVEGSVEDVKFDENFNVVGVLLATGELIKCTSVVLATGTFLNGVMRSGSDKTAGGRIGEAPSIGLSHFLKNSGIKVGRLKTGTPPRLIKNSIDFSELEAQDCDEQKMPFSYLNEDIKVPQLQCFITRTNPDAHKVLLDNTAVSPILSGDMKSRGPRYCPSIEDKIRRFSEKEGHQIFLEPEGLNSPLIYPNGISTSMPKDVQLEFLRKIKGLENVEVESFGYLIEYDYIDPRELLPTMQSKSLHGLFCSGQINGTTGYEEAAGQGLVAGVNAALLAQNIKNGDKLPEFVLDRHNSYIGVMIDDLTTLGVDGEPYRMFTSRSESRLKIRGDNADIRLTQQGINFGFVSQDRINAFTNRFKKVEELTNLLKQSYATPHFILNQGVDITQDGAKRSAFDLISARLISAAEVGKIWPDLQNEVNKFSSDVILTAESDAMYHLFIERQNKEIDRMSASFALKLDTEFDYSQIKSLSKEVVEKLHAARPSTIGSASRIPGVTPVAVMAIIVHLNTIQKTKQKANQKTQ